MKHILLISPHLDDAILSCGAYIIKNIKERNSITTVTVFSGSIEAHKLSSLAKWFHGICRLGNNAMEVRCIEDKKACRFLRTKCIHLNLHECLYRLNSYGEPRYSEEKSIYKADINNEQNTIDNVYVELLDKLQLNVFDEILVPLGIGRHIDHLIVRKAAEALEAKNHFNKGKIHYYEDTPYVCTDRDKDWKDDLAFNLNAKSYKISSMEFSTYTKALYFYKSQIDMLWENKTEMIKQLKKYYLKNDNNILSATLWKK